MELKGLVDSQNKGQHEFYIYLFMPLLICINGCGLEFSHFIRACGHFELKGLVDSQNKGPHEFYIHLLIPLFVEKIPVDTSFLTL